MKWKLQIDMQENFRNKNYSQNNGNEASILQKKIPHFLDTFKIKMKIWLSKEP